MRSRLSAPVALLYLLSTFLLLGPAVLAADDTLDEDEYEERARVLRLSLLKGEVSIKRAGEDEWVRARLNTPLFEGDLLATGRDARLEIQADARNFVRLGPDSVLKVVTLRDEGIAFSLSEGTATLRLSRFDRDKEYFEMDAPGTTVAAEKTGRYRLDVDRSGGVVVTVREDGRARIYSQTSGFVLRAERAARLVYQGAEEGDWEVGAAAQADEWDSWNEERERHLASRLRYEGRERYYDGDIYGAEELDLYGEWVNTRDYGYVWRPHATVINNYNDWAPYRYGHWEWCPPYGWTWIPDEAWGWAPYHYGRWVHVNNYWCWAPRGYGYRYGRARWRPALVAFVTLDFGRDRQVCWYPLTYGQRDPRGRWWSRRYDPLTPLRAGERERLRRANPALLRAVTSVPVREFGAGTPRARPAAAEVAQRALAGEPLRGPLPLARGDGSRLAPRVNGGTTGATRATGGREVLTINRPDVVAPARTLPDRPTGAAARRPGLPLDEELRRTRIFNNRERRVPQPSAASGGMQGGDARGRDVDTGVVERPGSRGGRTPASPADAGADGTRPRTAPTRPERVNPSDTNGGAEQPSRRPDSDEDGRARRTAPGRAPIEQPTAGRGGDERPPDETQRPAPVYRTEPRPRPRDEAERPAAPPPARREEPPATRRAEPPTYRHEPRAPRDSGAPRSEPSPRRESPPPRREEPRYEQPRPEPRREAPRQEAPRQEAPRQDAPRRETPRQESPRQEAPRQAPPARRDGGRPARRDNRDQR